MSRNSRDQRGQFNTMVRYDGRGRIIPGSNILKKGKKPKEGNWETKQAYECCNSNEGPFYWINKFIYTPPPTGRSNIMTYSDVDSQGNVYTATQTNSDVDGYDNWITKFNSKGDVILTKKLNLFGEVDRKAIRNINVASDFIYLVSVLTGEFGDNIVISVLDFNLNILKELQVYHQTFVEGIGFYNSVVTSDDLLFILFKNSQSQEVIVTYFANEEEIVLKEEKLISSDGVISNIFLDTLSIDSNNNLLISYNGDNIDGDGQGDIIKLYLNNDQITLEDSFTIDPLSVFWQNTATARDVNADINGNYYVLAREDLFKVDPTGNNILWHLYVEGSESFLKITTDSNNNLYLISDIRGLTIISRINSEGDVLWNYSISLESPLGFQSFNVSIENNSLVFGANNQSFKLPLNEVVPGTYGEYVISNYGPFTSLNTDPQISIERYNITLGPVDEPLISTGITSTVTQDSVIFNKTNLKEVTVP